MTDHLFGVTTQDTTHGPPWRGRAKLPAGSFVVVEYATNQPDDGPVQYWLVRVHAIPPEQLSEVDLDRLQSFVGGLGVGLGCDDIRICRRID